MYLELAHAAARTAHEQAIITYKGSSPLTPWLSYIAWTIEAHTTLSEGSHLTPLLEKCTRTFINDKSMHNDTGYVKVWLMYADRCPDPASIYQFMQARGIGETCAARYVAISSWHETRTDYKAAEAALQLGIDRSAKPTNTLTSAMSSLTARNAHRIAKQMEAMTAQLDPLDPLVTSAMLDDAPRKALTQIVDQENGELVRQSFTTAARPAAQQTFRAVAPTTARVGNASFQIFDDSRPVDQSAQSAQAESGWSTLPSMKVADKENAATITTWNVPLISKAEVRAPVASDIAVFTDLSCVAPLPATVSDADRQAHVAEVRKRLAGPSKPSTDAKLAQDPLRHLVKKTTAASNSSVPVAQPSSATSRATVPVAQPTSLLPSSLSSLRPSIPAHTSRPVANAGVPQVASTSVTLPTRSVLSTRPALSSRPPMSTTVPSAGLRTRPMGR